MLIKRRVSASDGLTLAGLATFFTFAETLNLWLLLPAVFFSLLLLTLLRSEVPCKGEISNLESKLSCFFTKLICFKLLKSTTHPFAAFDRFCFFPYASGLLIWPMRLFYWDRFDFAGRIQNLLILAGIFSVWLIFRQQRWWKKIRCHFNARGLKNRLWLIFIVSELLFIAASAIITRQGVALVGDEPHYLAISQSLARDGDLNVFNQYFRDGFKEYLPVKKLAAHGTWGKGFKKIYSYHLPGISLTLTPFFFLKLSPPLLYFLLRSFLGLFGAMLVVLVYLFCLRLWRSRRLAFFATIVFAFTAPIFFYSFHIFPEVQAMLLILSAMYLLFFKAEEKVMNCFWAGLLLGCTIFWGVKYALFIYPISLGFLVFWLRRKKFRPALLVMIMPLLFQVLFFYYLYSAYGNFSPNSVYYGMLSPAQAGAFYETILKKITLNMRWETLLDYFFDQRDGLLLYNPFYFFAFPGLLLALKNFKRYRLHLLAALPAMLFILNHAFSTIRPGYCPQGRYLAPVTWALLLFAIIYYRQSRSPFLKRVFLSLPLYSLFVSVYQTAQPFTLYQPTTHDTLVRPGLIFSNWSNIYCQIPDLLPSYIKTNNSGYLPNFLFLALFLLFLALTLTQRSWIRTLYNKFSFLKAQKIYYKVLTQRRGIRALDSKFNSRKISAAPPILFLAVFSLASLFPRPDLSAPQKLIDSRGHPGHVYFSPQPAAKIDDQTWVFSKRENCSILIESRLPLKSIQLELENRSERGTLQLEIAAFDEKPDHWQLPAAGAVRIHLPRPLYKKVKNRCFYQLHFQGKVSGGTAVPTWLLRINPR